MKQIMDQHEIDHCLTRVAAQIHEEHQTLEQTMLVGVVTRGDVLAHRLQGRLREMTGVEVPLGVLDITLYRDDLPLTRSGPVLRGSNLPCGTEGRRIVIVDDVLYTARTMRAAMYALMDYGRPACIEIFCLVDRGHNELPLYAKYLGRRIDTATSEKVQVHLHELDGEDAVYIQH